MCRGCDGEGTAHRRIDGAGARQRPSPATVGVVTKTFPGRDGVIRTVQVRTVKDTYTRSIQLQYCMIWSRQIHHNMSLDMDVL